MLQQIIAIACWCHTWYAPRHLSSDVTRGLPVGLSDTIRWWTTAGLNTWHCTFHKLTVLLSSDDLPLDQDSSVAVTVTGSLSQLLSQ